MVPWLAWNSEIQKACTTTPDSIFKASAWVDGTGYISQTKKEQTRGIQAQVIFLT